MMYVTVDRQQQHMQVTATLYDISPPTCNTEPTYTTLAAEGSPASTTTKIDKPKRHKPSLDITSAEACP